MTLSFKRQLFVMPNSIEKTSQLYEVCAMRSKRQTEMLKKKFHLVFTTTRRFSKRKVVQPCVPSTPSLQCAFVSRGRQSLHVSSTLFAVQHCGQLSLAVCYLDVFYEGVRQHICAFPSALFSIQPLLGRGRIRKQEAAPAAQAGEIDL